MYNNQYVNLISIIIPAYNPGEKLKRCLESVINQSYKNLEIIIIDDGSSDGTKFFCKKMVELDKRVTYFYQENKGVSAARNKGLDLCKGEYITFIDSDDFVDNLHIQELYEGLINNKAEISVCGITNEYDTLEIVTPNRYRMLNYGDFFRELISYDGFGGYVCNKLYSRETIGNIRFDSNLCIAEDLLFNFEVFLKIEKVYQNFNNTYHYIKNDLSASQLFNDDIEEFISKINSYQKSADKCVELIRMKKVDRSLIELLMNKSLLVKSEILLLKMKKNIDINNKQDFKNIKKVKSIKRLGASKKLFLFTLLIKISPSYKLLQSFVQ